MNQTGVRSCSNGGKMSRKVTIIISIVLFLILIALFVCEKRYPESGTQFLTNLLHR